MIAHRTARTDWSVTQATRAPDPGAAMPRPGVGPGWVFPHVPRLCVGWWASAPAVLLAYAAMLTVVGLPLAFFVVARLPAILTLRSQAANDLQPVQQRPWWQRAAYFAGVGWWAGAAWLALAWLVGALIVTLPLTFWMDSRAGGVMTLRRRGARRVASSPLARRPGATEEGTAMESVGWPDRRSRAVSPGGLAETGAAARTRVGARRQHQIVAAVGLIALAVAAGLVLASVAASKLVR